MKTIIFGGSFDPIHNGHIKLAKKALEVVSADRVVFMVAKNPRWKSKRTDDEHRYNMMLLALKDFPSFIVSRQELDSDCEINYTFDTISSFKKEQDEELYFLIGYDQLEQLDKWYRIDDLSKLVKFICISRPDYQINEENATKYNVLVIKESVSNMSSTKLRELQCLDAPKEVLNYIVDNELYYIPKIKSYINLRRYEHTISVANLAYHIALNNGVDESKAYIASLLHDIGKNVNDDKQEEIASKYDAKNYMFIPKVLYHQYTSVEIAKSDFNIHDEEILDAIKYHGTGKPNMSKIGKIVYASDKIDPSRGYNSQDMINECLKDIDSGFNFVLSENIKFFKIKNMEYKNPLTIECIKYYLGEKFL